MVTVQIQRTEAPSFADALSNPGVSRLNNEMGLLQVGIGADLVTPVWIFYAPLAIGLRGGYRMSLKGDGWSLENGPDLVDGPELDRTGPFLQLQLGLAI